MISYPILPVKGVGGELDSLMMQADYNKGVGITLRFTPIHLTEYGFQSDPMNKYIMYFTLQPSERLTPTIKKRIAELTTKLENWKLHLAAAFNDFKDDRQSFVDLITAWAEHSPLAPPSATANPQAVNGSPSTTVPEVSVSDEPSLSLIADLYFAGRFFFFFG